ncbi:nuclear transport factor 2 family protein [Paraburkholderia acidicola]|uniref:Nuclear transport factor 2 family protein n=1 Tax=Paraburkholderia acidicola TaxID=1912599 RepID=A0ABV1LPT1_9BURK
MKKFVLSVAASLLLASSAFASTADESAVNDAMQRLSAAMTAADAQQMKDLTADTLSYGHSNGLVQNQTEFVTTIASGQTKYRRIDLTQTVTTVTGDAAVMRDHFTGTVVEPDGKVADVALNVLLVWQKQHGAWKLLARQAFH